MKAFISRILAAPIAALVAWLTSAGLDLDPGFDAMLTETATLLVLALVMAVYGVAHKFLDRWINPSDSATPSG